MAECLFKIFLYIRMRRCFTYARVRETEYSGIKTMRLLDLGSAVRGGFRGGGADMRVFVSCPQNLKRRL